MNRTRLEQIDQIFQAALELAPVSRAAFLDEACSADANLRLEVESLLSAHEHAGNFIEGSASDVAASLLKNNPRPPRHVGQYKIEGLLGTGGMGEVYLAIDKLGRRVALKLLPEQVPKDHQHVTRFLQEAQTLLALNHPNIVTIYDIGEADNTHYIASELIEGENLRRSLETRKLDLDTVLEILIQVATALSAAHEKGIVHRDIKPENVMIRTDGYVKVLDFGIAKLTEAFASPISTAAPTRPRVETAEGTVVGTAAYMSPEQARGTAVDARTDIWSCGVLLYEMLAGKAPFGGESAMDILARILEREPPPLSHYLPNQPADLQRIIDKALTKDREGRYQTIKEMLLDLKVLQRELVFAAKLERPSPSRTGRTLSSKGAADELSVGDSLPRPTARDELGATNKTAMQPVSSVEHIVAGIKQHRRTVIIGLLGLLVATVGIGYWWSIHRSSNVTTIDSIAVMPFENVTHDQNTEYLSDGITESLINSLSQLPRIKVIARNSVFSYKNQTPNLQQVATQLNVQALLTGRVLMQGDTLDVRVELTDAQNNIQLWGDHFTRKVGDVFAVQDEIARQVTDTLRLRLTGPQQEQVTKRYTENAEAYRLYLQGRYVMNDFSEENLNRAITFFDRAIALDPRYALAYAARGECFFTLGDLSLQMSEAKQKAKQNVEAALRIDDRLVEARTIIANIKFQYDWDFTGAEEDFKQAIALNPNYAEAHHQYAWYLATTGRTMEGLAEMKLAQQLDPVNPSINVDVFLPYYLARQFDAAIAQSRKTLDTFPNFYIAHMTLGMALLEKGDYSRGIEELEKAQTLEPTPHLIGTLGYAYGKSGRKEEARKLAADLKELSKHRYVAPFWIGMIYVGLGEKDEAFAWFEKAYQERSWWLIFTKMEPMMDSLRSDSRFIDLLRRIGFPK